MDNYKAISRADGGHHFVKVRPGSHPTDEGCDPDTHDYVLLDREPEEHDVCGPDHKLVRCEATRRDIDAEAALALMSRADLVKTIMSMVDERIAERMRAISA